MRLSMSASVAIFYTLMWLYRSNVPASLSMLKAIEAAADASFQIALDGAIHELNVYAFPSAATIELTLL